MKRRLAYIEPWFERWSTPRARNLLKRRGTLELVALRENGDAALNIDLLTGVHGYQIPPGIDLQPTWYGDAAFIARCPQLLAICTTGAGFDVVDVEACTDAGIIVCNQAGLNKEAVAEHAVGLMLALSKKIGLSDKLLRRSEPHDYLSLRGSNVYGKTIGIIGFGHIGRRVAEICRKGFDMKVLAYDPFVPEEDVRACHATKVGLDEIFQESDVISVHCSLTPETASLIGERQFSLMKETAFFISTARGGIHDEAALADALSNARIAGAGLDVFVDEPPPSDHPLLEFDNVVATPHIAGMTEQTIEAMSLANALQWLRIFDGDVPPRLVNTQAWAAYQHRFERLLGIRPADIS